LCFAASFGGGWGSTVCSGLQTGRDEGTEQCGHERGRILTSKEIETEELEWDRLVALVLHPTKVAIIETIRRVGSPMSANDLRESYGLPEAALSGISYHLDKLVKAGVLQAEKAQSGSANRRALFYSFTCLLVPEVDGRSVPVQHTPRGRG
jgi:DNA-binding transcriptional ArsR family regulator